VTIGARHLVDITASVDQSRIGGFKKVSPVGRGR
jgi:hypothetical protein